MKPLKKRGREHETYERYETFERCDEKGAGDRENGDGASFGIYFAIDGGADNGKELAAEEELVRKEELAIEKTKKKK